MAEDLYVDLYAVIEACKQHMERSFDTFQQRMDANFQRLIDTAQQRHSSFAKVMACERNHEEAINQTLQKLENIRLDLIEEEEQDYLPIILEEQIPPVINSSPVRIEDVHNTSLEQSNVTTESTMPTQNGLQKLNDISVVLVEEEKQDTLPITLEERLPTFITSTPTITKDIHHKDLAQINEPPIQAEYDFVLPSSTAAIKNDYEDVLEEHYFVKMLPMIAPTEFVLNNQETTRNQVFDPGGNNLTRISSYKYALKTLSKMVSAEIVRNSQVITQRNFVFDPGGIIEAAKLKFPTMIFFSTKRRGRRFKRRRQCSMSKSRPRVCIFKDAT